MVGIWVPLLPILLNSFKRDQEIKSASGLHVLPKHWTLSGYHQVLTDNNGEFLIWLRNSVFVALVTMIIDVFLSATAAYVFSRFIFPGRESVLNFFLVTQMFPAAILLVPIYQILIRFPIFHFSMLDSVQGLLLVYSTIAVTCFFTFITAWNEVAFANVVEISPEHYTLPVGLRTYIFQFDQAWQKLSVSAVIVTVPSLIVFLFAQRYLVSGLTRGAVKG